MEDSGFNLMAGFIAATVIVMGISLYTAGLFYSSAESTIMDSLSTMSTQEKDAFNNQFAAYEGTQTGTKVKAIISVLIANSNTYQDEIAKIPSLKVADKVNSAGDEVEDATMETLDDLEDYVKNLGTIRRNIEDKHTYQVEMTYNVDGLINEITIYYEQ